MSTVSPPRQPAEAEPPAQPAPRRRGFGSVGNMLRSMAVVFGLVAGLVLLVPRQNAVVQPPVDVMSLAHQVAGQTRWPVLAAQGLPDGWRATSARYERSTDGLMTWHAGYISPAQQYVAVEQTQAASDLWVQAETNRGKAEGPLVAAGRTWQKVDRLDKVQFSLVDRRPGSSAVTTVITGTAPYAVLADFAGHLKPVSAS